MCPARLNLLTLLHELNGKAANHAQSVEAIKIGNTHQNRL